MLKRIADSSSVKFSSTRMAIMCPGKPGNGMHEQPETPNKQRDFLRRICFKQSYKTALDDVAFSDKSARGS